MANMRQPATQQINDRRVWVQGDNGITCVRWLSTVMDRLDVKVLTDYVEGDQFPDDVNNRPKPEAPKKTTRVAKATETKTEE